MAETHHCEDCQKLNTDTRLYIFSPARDHAIESSIRADVIGFVVTNPTSGRIPKDSIEICRPCLDKRISDFWDSF